jgi:hypothetical protein
MRCTKCNATGQYLGNGMQMTDCEVCDGTGTVRLTDKFVGSILIDDPLNKLAAIDKRSRLYKDSIKEIMSTNSNMSRTDAERMFDKAYAKG